MIFGYRKGGFLMKLKKKDTTQQSKSQKSGTKTAQETLLYDRIYKNGIMEIEPHWYSKSYKLHDINFSTISDEEQEAVFFAFSDAINALDAGVNMQVTFNNRNIDMEQFKKDVLLPHRGDNIDELRDEYNQMLLENIEEGQNAIKTEKYITISTYADDIDTAKALFGRIDTDVARNFKRITKEDTPPLKVEERLEVLYDIYHVDSPEDKLNRTTKVNGKDVKSFDLAEIKKRGLTTKDVIAPVSFNFKHKDYFQVGDKYGRAMFLQELPVSLSTNFIEELTNLPYNMVTSIMFEPQPQDKAMKMIKNQIVNINSNVIEAQKKASKSGYSADLISPTLRDSSQEAEDLLSDMTTRNQKMFFVTLSLMVFADTLDQLNKYSDTISTIGNKYLCQIKILNYQQEAGMNSSLPLGHCKIHAQKMLTTESASIFLPFSTMDYAQRGGMFYGKNAVSRNMILFNRLSSKNQNAVFLGTPGSGKSFFAKREIVNAYLSHDCDVFILDPEREYTALAKAFNGEIVRLAPGGQVHINPFDMDIDFAKDDKGENDDPVTLKTDFILGLCETMVSSRFGLSPIQHSIIDRCVRALYQPYLEYLNQNGLKSDIEHAPDMRMLYDILLQQPEAEAKSLALEIEMYAKGSLNTFAFKTNVETNNRFVVYDIKDIGTGMKALGLQVCLNDVWNRIITNFRKGRRTWLYIDEFYLLTQQESSAKFLQQIWKRARKWGGVPTGITQNVEDLLISPAARGIINNCDFVAMLNQSPLDRQELSKMLNISEANQEYITNADPGQGLLYTGKTIIPFIDRFPTNTKLYKIMSTNPNDDIDMTR